MPGAAGAPPGQAEARGWEEHQPGLRWRGENCCSPLSSPGLACRVAVSWRLLHVPLSPLLPNLSSGGEAAGPQGRGNRGHQGESGQGLGTCTGFISTMPGRAAPLGAWPRRCGWRETHLGRQQEREMAPRTRCSQASEAGEQA